LSEKKWPKLLRLAWPRVALSIMTGTIVMLAIYILPWVLPATPALVKISLWASESSRIDVYVNDETRPPFSQDLIGREQRTYVFQVAAEDIHFLRFDLGKVPRSQIQVCEISIEDEFGLVAYFDGTVISQKWGAVNVASAGVSEGCLRLLATTDSPLLYTKETIILRRMGPAFIHDIVRATNKPAAVVGIVTIGYALLFLTGVLRPRRRLHVWLGAMAIVVTVLLAVLILPNRHALPPVDRAVGRIALMGLSRDGSTLAMIIAVTSSTVAAITASVISSRRRQHRSNPGLDRPAETTDPAIKRPWLTVACLTVIVLLQVPDLAALLGEMAHREFVPHWDSNNVMTWAYLSHNGYVPFRDYWYPYGGQYIFDWPAPWGLLASIVSRALLFGLFFAALRGALGSGLVLPLVSVLAILQGESTVFPAITRYLLSAAIVLAYIAIDRRLTRPGRAHAVFWAATALALFIEPVQLAYAAPFLAISVALDARETAPRWREFARALFVVFAVPVGLLVTLLIWSAAQGQAPGMRDFYLGLGDAADFGAMPTDILLATRFPLSTQFLIFVAPPVLISLGVFERLHSAPGQRRHAEMLLGLGLIGVMVFQKHALRPIDDQAFYIPFLGLIAYGSSFRWRDRTPELLVLGAIVGAYLGIMAHSGQFDVWVRNAVDIPRRVVEAPAALGQSALIRDANIERFAPERFRQFADELAVVSRVRAEEGGSGARVLVLSDDPVIYVLLRQAPPYHTNIYSASPIYEQRKMSDWVRTSRPEFVIWNPRNTLNDGVQAWVRGPLLYDAVIDGYVPMDRVGRFEVLRRRRTDEAVPLDYWREQLGTQSLGSIPRESTFPRLAPCPIEGRQECGSFLKIDVSAPPQQETPLAIVLRAGGLDFTVDLTVSPGQRTYYISLDRLWFYTALRRAGVALDVAFDRLSPGVMVTLLHRAITPEILY
jgi:hypothetical protein